MTTLSQHGFSTAQGLNRYIVFNEKGIPFYVTKGRNPQKNYLLAAINGCHIADVFQQTFNDVSTTRITEATCTPHSPSSILDDEDILLAEEFLPVPKYKRERKQRMRSKTSCRKRNKSVHHSKLYDTDIFSDEEQPEEDEQDECVFSVKCFCYECRFERFKARYDR